MKESPQDLELHLFVCTNKKEGKPCCADKNSQSLKDELKARLLKIPNSKARLRVNNAGCLGKCEEGIAAVLYPEGLWMTNLTISDVNRVEALVKSKLK